MTLTRHWGKSGDAANEKLSSCFDLQPVSGFFESKKPRASSIDGAAVIVSAKSDDTYSTRHGQRVSGHKLHSRRSPLQSLFHWDARQECIYRVSLSRQRL